MQHRCRPGPAGLAGTFFVLMCLAGVCSAADFAADIIDGHSAPGKLYFADGRVRIETPAVTTGFFLIQSGAAVFVRPGQDIFTDARQSTPLTQLFIPVDPDDPCPRWQAAAKNAGVPGAEGEWRCEKLESGSHARWRVTPPGQNPRECWIDASLRFPVRIRTSDGATLSLDNIRRAAQSPDLFTIPATYRRLDPHALIEHIKRSDVWAEPPAAN